MLTRRRSVPSDQGDEVQGALGVAWTGVFGLALILALVVAYIPALQGGFVWDDKDNVINSRPLIEPGGLRRIWTDLHSTQQYYPLTHSSFWLERRLWGLRPLGWHVTNLALHAGSTLLLWRILTFLGVPGAWFGAMLFALHPVQAESVAWVSERKNTLSGFLALLSVLLLLRRTTDESRQHDAGLRAVIPSFSALGVFFAALLAKTAVSVLPLGMVAVLWWRNGRLGRRDVLVLVPFVVLGGASGLLTAWLERTHVGAVGAGFDLSLPQRILVAGHAFWWYPASLLRLWDRPFIPLRWDIQAGDLTAWLYPIAAVAFVALLWALRRRIGRGFLAAVLWYAALIFPALGFFNLYFTRYSFVQDHFQYLACIGPLTLAGAWTTITLRRLSRLVDPAKACFAAGLVALVVLTGLTRLHSNDFRDNETLWRRTLALNPNAIIAHGNLGLLLQERGDYEGAMAQYQAALRLSPNESYIQNNIGMVFTSQGRPWEAETCFRQALHIDPTNAQASNNLGTVLEAAGKDEEALEAYEAAVRLQSDFFMAHYNLGCVLMRMGRYAEAAGHLRETLRQAPGYSDARLRLDLVLEKLGGKNATTGPRP